tara:strand:+ start:626 stop:1138 length:513 start_codon:yes stop_codon:yes gene_type:complete
MSLSLIWPFNVSDEGYSGWESFGESPEEKRSAIKQNLRFLLLTRPGEYTMDADFGVGIQRLLFQQGSSIGQPIERIGTVNTFNEWGTPRIGSPGLQGVEMIREEAVIPRIQSQVAKYMPYINLLDVNLNTDDLDTNGIRITIRYSITIQAYDPGTQVEDVLEFVTGVSIG